MKDSTFKMILTKDSKRVYVDLEKGARHVFDQLKKLGFNDPNNIVCSDIDVKFTGQGNILLTYLKLFIKEDDRIMDISRAYQYIQYEKGFNRELMTLIKSNKVKTVNDICNYGNLFWFNKTIENRNIELGIQEAKEKNLSEMTFNPITIFNKPALFTPSRIDRKELPKGVYLYECQHDDDQNGEITMLGNHITVNFWGSVLTTKKIALHEGFKSVDEYMEVEFHNTEAIKLDDYLKKHPIINKQLER